MNDCSHTYDVICRLCGQDASYNWLDCVKYKKGCLIVCNQCGEVESKSYGDGPV